MMGWNRSFVDGPIAIVTTDIDGNATGNVPGYHLNLAAELARPELESFRQYPGTPQQVWAGDEPVWSTIFLRFVDEAAAGAALPALWTDEA